MVSQPNERLKVTSSPVVLIGVTVDLSLSLMTGIPEYLRDKGWSVHVACAPGPRLESLSSSAGIATHGIAMERDPSPLADLRSLWEWGRLIRRIRPDLVSVGTPKAGLLGGIAAWFAGVPARVYVLRGLRLETLTGFRRAVMTMLERVSCAVAHEVIAVSPSLRDLAVELRLVPARKVRVLGEGSSNGVDLARFTDAISDSELATLRKNLGMAIGVPVIGFVGRLSVDKGLRMLAQARRILAAREVDHQLLIVGPVEDSQSQTVLEELRGAGRPPIELGYVSDPAPYFQLIDVLCLPTFREGFPNVVLEAAAAGKPSITTDATGAIDSVVDGHTGLIFPVGAGDVLADHLERLLVDSEERMRMGSGARARVERSFRRELVWSRIESEYRSLHEAARR